MLTFFENTKVEHSLLFRKVLFALSRTYICIGDFDAAYETYEKGMKLTLKDESTYLLGELLFQKGKVLKRKGFNNDSLLVFNQAKVLFQLNHSNKNIDKLTVIR